MPAPMLHDAVQYDAIAVAAAVVAAGHSGAFCGVGRSGAAGAHSEFLDVAWITSHSSMDEHKQTHTNVHTCTNTSVGTQASFACEYHLPDHLRVRTLFLSFQLYFSISHTLISTFENKFRCRSLGT